MIAVVVKVMITGLVMIMITITITIAIAIAIAIVIVIMIMPRFSLVFFILNDVTFDSSNNTSLPMN